MVSTKTARPSTDASTKPGSSKRVRLLHRDKKIKLETTILDAGLPAALAATAIACKVPKFLRSLYAILQTEDPHIISWVQNKDLTPNCITAFHILQMERFEREILPKYFKHRKFASFQRQLNNFGFRKWTKTQSSGVCTFSHNCFPPDLSGSDGSTMSIRDQWRQKSTQVVPPLGSQSLHQRVVGNSITKVKTKQPQLNYSNSSSRRRPVNVQVPERDMTDSSPCSAGVYRSPSANAGMETSSFRHSLSHQPPLKKLARPNLAIKQDLSDSLNGLEAFCDSSYKPLILPPLQPRHVAATGTLAPCFSNHSEPDIPRVSSEFRLSLSQVLSTNSSVTAESSFNNSGPKVFSPKHCDAQPPSCPPVENQHGGNDGMADAVALQGFFLEPWLWDAQASSSSFESGSFSLDFDCKSDFDCKTEFDWQEASCVAGSAGIPNKEQCHRQDRSEASNAEEFGLDTLLLPSK